MTMTASRRYMYALNALRKPFFLLLLSCLQAQACIEDTASYPHQSVISTKRKLRRQNQATNNDAKTTFSTGSYWDLVRSQHQTERMEVEYQQHPHERYLSDTIEDTKKYRLKPKQSTAEGEKDNGENQEEDSDGTMIPNDHHMGLEGDTYLPTIFDDDFARETNLYHQNSNLFDQHGGSNHTSTSSTTSSYKPIRIKFITEPLKERRGKSSFMDQQLDEILQQAIPQAAQIWATHLLVHPVSGSISVDQNSCFGSFASVLQKEPTQISDADLVIIVSAYNELLSPDGGEPTTVCNSRSLAVGAACTLDQYDRPVLGFVNLCLKESPDSETSDLNELVSKSFKEAHGLPRQPTVNRENGTSYNELLDSDHQRVKPTHVLTHEVAHTLGFDSYLFKFFRNATTGEPLTQRPFQTTTVRCPNGSEEDIFGLPSNKVLQMSRNNRGDSYFDIVTPRVAQVVKNHFNCDSMVGARLENFGASCIGSHWDERLFLTDVMSPALSWKNDLVSPLTLAFLEDTGWYRARYEDSVVPTFGLGAGCDFVNADCIVDGRVTKYAKDYFCDSPIRLQDTEGFQMAEESDSHIKCDPTHQYWALCDLWDASTIPDSVPFPGYKASSYFDNDELAVTFPQADFCPVAHQFLGVDCASENPDDFERRSATAYPGEESGPSSRCINAFSDISPQRNRRVSRPACMHVSCDKERRRVIVGTGSFQQSCDFDGQVLHIPTTEAGYLECPRLSSVCPELFCPASCSGRGVCDYSAQPYPKCQCFDPENTSDGCYESTGPVGTPTQPAVQSTSNVGLDIAKDNQNQQELFPGLLESPASAAEGSYAFLPVLLPLLLLLVVR